MSNINMNFKMTQKAKRTFWVVILALLVLYAIPWTADILSPILNFELFSGIKVITILAISSFYPLVLIYNRDL